MVWVAYNQKPVKFRRFIYRYYFSFTGKHLVLVTDVEKAEPEFAFDNPGFRGE